MLALCPCPSFPTFPYRFLLLFLLLSLFLFLSRTLAFTGKSPLLHGFFSGSSSSPWRRKARVEVISVQVYLSQMASVGGNASRYRKFLPTCSSCMTPHTSAIMSVRDGTAFLGIDELLAPAAPAGAASSLYGAMGATFSCFFVVHNFLSAIFWSRLWRFQLGLCDDRTHRQQYQMNITPTPAYHLRPPRCNVDFTE